jgi:hypothetical protein
MKTLINWLISKIWFFRKKKELHLVTTKESITDAYETYQQASLAYLLNLHELEKVVNKEFVNESQKSTAI